MTQQEIAALKARFQAGGYPTQQDFESLVDAVAAAAAGSSSGSSSNNNAPVGPVVIHVTNLIRDKIAYNSSTNNSTNTGEFNGSNPFQSTTVHDIVTAYEQIKNTSLADVDTVIIVNETWDFPYTHVSNSYWEKESYGGFGGEFEDSDSSMDVNTANLPMYIKTKYANLSPTEWAGAAYQDTPNEEGEDEDLYVAASNKLYEYDSSHSFYNGTDAMAHDPEYVIDVIPDGNAMMFVKRLPYTDSQNHGNTIDWVPVSRNVTITEYELGQMEQDFAAINSLT